MSVNGRHRNRTSLGLAALVGVTGVAAAVIAFSGGNDEAAAAESCQGLDTALQNNLTFIAQQQAAPDAQSAARIENREAVVDQLLTWSHSRLSLAPASPATASTPRCRTT
jgi:hypothetical protein